MKNLFFLFLSIWFAVPSFLAAATIKLSNGDTITGEIVQRIDGQAIIKHDLIGGFSVPEKDIVSITAAIVEEILEEDVVEELAEERPDSFTLQGNAQISDGNTNRKLYGLQADYETKYDNHRYTLSADYNYGESEGERDADNIAALAKYDNFFQEKWYWYNSLNYYRDDFQSINTRLAFSTGLGHQFINTKRSRLDIELGPSFVYEKTDADEDTYLAGRWMIDAEHEAVKDRLELFHKQTGLLSFENTQDVSIRAETGIRLPVYERWHGFVQMNNTWEGDPVEDREAFDTTYLLGIGFGW